MRVARRLLLPACLLVVGACGGGDGGVGPGGRGKALKIVAGAGVTDTVLAAPAQALVVEVRDVRGAPASGVLVRFESLPSADQSRLYETPMFVCGLAQQSCGPNGPFYQPSTFAVDSTREDGRAAVAVRLGTIAGPAGVVVKVPELGLQDTVRFTVLPGAPAAVVAAVRDTVVYVGATYRLAARVTDRYGNARGDAVTYAALGSAGVVDASGTVTGTAIGRGAVVSRAGGAADTTYLTVPPRGTLVVYDASSAAPGSAIYVVDLDGSGSRRIVTTSGSDGTVPVWASDGAHVAYQEAGLGGTSIMVADLAGTTRRVLDASPAVAWARLPTYSRDGAWLYFLGAGAGSPAAQTGVWRARPDGTGAEFLAASTAGSYEGPSPSPDGTRVAFTSAGTLRILTLATGQVSDLGIVAYNVRWSPAGDVIAYQTANYYGSLALVRPDGTGRRSLSASGLDPWFTWSPDGAWLVFRGQDRLQLVRAATGEVLPLRLKRDLFQPSWKP